MKEITKAKFINTWASEWDERTGWKVSEEYHKQFSEQLEYLINQEVEKRIVERMPSDELIEEIQEKSLLEYENAPICEIDYYSGFEDGVKWLRSRLTCSEKPNNSKTEGGRE